MDAVKRLPFVKDEGAGLNLWNVLPSGDWAADNKTGRAHGEACVAFMRGEKNPAILFTIVDTIVRRAEAIGGIECGFFQTIAEATIR
ncbi:hypothetical protein [Bradyrhizobium sp. WSM3983]|uniref:hypothetical protein n=1 Tax=Bradyrhizobium sp. WSM3983 TaxID=1038867 RepID=UPI000481C110|nr:hypothetical protein [Bradyrhizobium sp. WSM3983]